MMESKTNLVKIRFNFKLGSWRFDSDESYIIYTMTRRINCRSECSAGWRAYSKFMFSYVIPKVDVQVIDANFTGEREL